jgi:hypothetical protein
MRGRKPKPTYLKLLNGNPGKRPLNEQEPKPQPALRVGKPDSALRAYESAVPLLQRLTEIAPDHNRSWQSDLAEIQAGIEKAKQALRDSRGATGDAPAKGIVDEHG